MRLSVDQEVWARFGRHGVDHPADRYAGRSEIAESAVRERLVDLVREGCDVVLDLSLWRRADRDAYEALVQGASGRWRLVHLSVEPAELHRRLAERAERRDADAASVVTDELLATYLVGFETPDGEGGCSRRTASRRGGRADARTMLRQHHRRGPFLWWAQQSGERVWRAGRTQQNAAPTSWRRPP